MDEVITFYQSSKQVSAIKVYQHTGGFNFKIFSGKQMLVCIAKEIAMVVSLVTVCVMDVTITQPLHMGGGHDGGSNIGDILATKIILSFLQQHG